MSWSGHVVRERDGLIWIQQGHMTTSDFKLACIADDIFISFITHELMLSLTGDHWTILVCVSVPFISTYMHLTHDSLGHDINYPLSGVPAVSRIYGQLLGRCFSMVCDRDLHKLLPNVPFYEQLGWRDGAPRLEPQACFSFFRYWCLLTTGHEDDDNDEARDADHLKSLSMAFFLNTVFTLTIMIKWTGGYVRNHDNRTQWQWGLLSMY
jgi:hypothetical protein